MQINSELETLAVAGHGGAVVLHSLAAMWHVVQSKKFDRYAALHVGLAIFSGVSVAVHAKRIREVTYERNTGE